MGAKDTDDFAEVQAVAKAVSALLVAERFDPRIPGIIRYNSLIYSYRDIRRQVLRR
jgi:hypothetical protein